MGKSGGRKKKSAATATATVAAAAAAPPPPTPPPPAANGVAPEFLTRVNELKDEGNRRFESRDFSGALHLYSAALRLLPAAHPDRAVFHSNRAACLMLLRPVDHNAVVAECSLALQAQPRFPRPLFRRARALQALSQFELALKDVEAFLVLEPGHSEALDLARRLRSQLTHPNPQPSRPSPAALGASAALGAPIPGLGPCLPSRKKPPPPPPAKPHPHSLAPPPAFKPTDSSSPSPSTSTVQSAQTEIMPAVIRWESTVRKLRPLKLVYDHDIRLAQMPANCSFRELREIVGKRFPASNSVLIKYKDPDGDLVTVTTTAELRLAELSVDGVKEGSLRSEVITEEALKLLRLHVVEVAPEQEPPVPDEEEPVPVVEVSAGEIAAEAVDTDIVVTGPEEEVVKDESRKKECDHAECKEAEIDDWLLEFAQLFRNQVGVDPEAHLDLHELGMELCSEALEETVTSEAAQGLFEQAAAKFQEVAALAFFNWGNVHMCAARKRIPVDESSSKTAMADQLDVAYDWVQKRYALAGQKYEEALRIKPDFYEGLLALGQQHFETAKLHWSFAQASKVDLTTWDATETIALFDSAEEKMKAATVMWEKVEEQRITELKDPGTSKKDELLKKKKKQGVEADGQGELSADEAAEQAAVMRSQIHLFWGNMLFERSQVEFKLGVGDWKKNLDTAVERFKLAGASEPDISAVLKNHASNEVTVECDEKKVVDVNPKTSETNTRDEDKHVLET